MMDAERAEDGAKAAVRAMARLLPDVYGSLRPSDVMAADIYDVIVAAKTLHFVMQEIILPAFRVLSDEPEVEQEASVFDRYDEENGYNDEEAARTAPWAAVLESLDVITQATITIMKQSYTATMREEIVPLIQHLRWEIDHQPKQKKGG